MTVEDDVANLRRKLGDAQALNRQALDAALTHTRTHKDVVVGLGAPTHQAPVGTLYWDDTNNVFYVNNSGGQSWTSIGGGSAGDHVFLDGSVHTDTVAQGATRGSLIVGNSTPAWDEKLIGAAARILQSDGSDPSWVAVSSDATIAAGGALTVAGTHSGSPHHDADEIVDDDGDTGWRAEQSADEDILRARTAGTEVLVISDTAAGAGAFGGTAHQLHLKLIADYDILIDGSTNERTIDTGVMRFEQTPAIENTRAVTVNVDVNSQPGTHAVAVNMIATQIQAGETISCYDVNIQAANSTGGVVRGFEMSIAGSGGVEAHMLHADPGVVPLSHFSGSFINTESAWKNALDVTTPFQTSDPGPGANNVELWSANADVVTLGMDATFDNIEVVLETFASGAGIKPVFAFSIAGPSWTNFTPEDETRGMRMSGIIDWDISDLTNWAATLDNGVTKFWIRITRNIAALTTPPVEDTIKVQTVTQYGWDALAAITALSLSADTISERTPDAGVTIDGLLIKDGGIPGGSQTPWAQNIDAAAFAITDIAHAVLGHTERANAGAFPILQVLGTGEATNSLLIGAWKVANNVEGDLRFLKAVTAAIETPGPDSAALVADDEFLGAVIWHVTDGVDYNTNVARFGVEVDDASPAENQIGAAFVWKSMSGGLGADTRQEVMRLTSAGILVLPFSLQVDTIDEKTSDAGVTIDGVLLKDSTVDGVDIAARDHAKYTNSEAVAAVKADVGGIRYLTFVLIDQGTDVSVAQFGGDWISPVAGTILQDDSDKTKLMAYTDAAGTTGTMVVDIHLNGATIMTTHKLDIETTEKTTQDNAQQPVLTTTAIAKGDILTFFVDAKHTTAAEGLKVQIAIRES